MTRGVAPHNPYRSPFTEMPPEDSPRPGPPAFQGRFAALCTLSGTGLRPLRTIRSSIEPVVSGEAALLKQHVWIHSKCLPKESSMCQRGNGTAGVQKSHRDSIGPQHLFHATGSWKGGCLVGDQSTRYSLAHGARSKAGEDDSETKR